MTCNTFQARAYIGTGVHLYCFPIHTHVWHQKICDTGVYVPDYTIHKGTNRSLFSTQGSLTFYIYIALYTPYFVYLLFSDLYYRLPVDCDM